VGVANDMQFSVISDSNPFFAGFVWSWKTWKSNGILKCFFPGLEKSLKNFLSQKFWKSRENLLDSYLHLRSLIKRLNIYINMYSFNQTVY